MICYVHTGYHVDPLLAVTNLAALLCCWYVLQKHNELELKDVKFRKI